MIDDLKNLTEKAGIAGFFCFAGADIPQETLKRHEFSALAAHSAPRREEERENLSVVIS